MRLASTKMKLELEKKKKGIYFIDMEKNLIEVGKEVDIWYILFLFNIDLNLWYHTFFFFKFLDNFI